MSAVFFVTVSKWIGPMIAGWLAAGHRIQAVVSTAPATRRAKRFGTRRLFSRIDAELSLTRNLRRHGVRHIVLAYPIDWDALAAELGPLDADVLVSMAFSNLVPDKILTLFPSGGVNLHPALLPNYRGPKPIHRLVLDDAWRRHGGVTLHRMSGRFDRGELLACVDFDEDDWRTPSTLVDAVASANRALALEAVPLHVAGELGGVDQSDVSSVWATFEKKRIYLTPEHGTDHAAKLSAFFRATPGITVEADGRSVRLSALRSRLGPPTGAPPRIGRLSADFDLKDARVRYGRYIGFLERLRLFGLRLAALRPMRLRPRHVRYFAHRDAGPRDQS